LAGWLDTLIRTGWIHWSVLDRKNFSLKGNLTNSEPSNFQGAYI
jgi:hypothetical protein